MMSNEAEEKYRGTSRWRRGCQELSEGEELVKMNEREEGSIEGKMVRSPTVCVFTFHPWTKQGSLMIIKLLLKHIAA